MNQKDKKILELNGWIVECESPFEIRKSKTESFASNEAAELILSLLMEDAEFENNLILETATQYVDIYNETNDDSKDIDSLINLGVLGVKTIRELITHFYYFFKEKELL